MSDIHFDITPTTIQHQEDHLRIDFSTGKITATLAGFIFLDKDANVFVAYLPSLEVSGYGSTVNDAQEMFKFSIKDFFDYLTQISIEEVQRELRKLGWKKNSHFNKRFSKDQVNIRDLLKDYNIEESTLQRITLSAA
ncbi:MAG TPA: hypothetical protein VH396_08615 [Chitinophagaceae bacterium]|jgi:hypothetical protein